MNTPKPVILCILDGWGLDPGSDANAPLIARTPHFDRLMETCPHAQLTTHGPDVGLPSGQMGNSEVGHTNIGAGRVVAMDLGQIDLAIEDGSFSKNAALLDFAAKTLETGGTAHLLGVISDGGVHGHIDHIIASAKILTSAGIEVAIHALTDGRDVAPKSAQSFVAKLVDELPKGARIATVTGRFYAMDRDNRWERVSSAYAAIHDGTGEKSKDAVAAIDAAYQAGTTDEFIPPTVLDGYSGLKDGDSLFCLNFRADRVREILAMLADPEFDSADRGDLVNFSAVLGMAEYSTRHNEYIAAVFPKRKLVNTLGEWVAEHGKTQLRVAETEKYPHVTFFLNGGKETPEVGEDRFMAPSPKVATYDLQPEMSAAQVTGAVVAGIKKGYDLIVVNFANPDMVGHTGDLSAAVKACETVDHGLGEMLTALSDSGGAMIVTADHGNCETMIDPDTGGPHTAHTTNPVPVILTGGPASAHLVDGRLADLAPTLLELMGMAQPAEMTGNSLIRS